MNTQPSRPVITPAMREQAAKQPNTWLYVVDPIFTDPSAEVPQWGFIGGYRVDERGQITDDFSPNPNYRPSPVALRLPAPANDVERALQLTTTGYAQGQTLLSALIDAELILFAQPQGHGLFTMEHETGRRQLQVFTSDNYLPSNWTTWQRMTGRQLAAQSVVGIDLQINPTSQVKARIPGEDLMKAAGIQPAPAGQVPAKSATNGAVGPAAGQPASPAPSAPKPAQESTGAAASTTEHNASDPAASEFGQRFLGSLLASAIGDALGASVEFYPVEQIRSRFGDQGVTDYDRNAERPGEFTDDTQMSLFTLEGLIRGHLAIRKGLTDTTLPALQLAYQRWLHTQGYAWTRAAGAFSEAHPDPDGWLISNKGLFSVQSPSSSCITSLREFAGGTAPGTFEHAINESKACGGVVRATPVALWSDHAREVFELGAASAALTDSDPSGYLPAGVLAVTVQHLLRGDTLTDALDRARSLLRNYTGHEPTERAIQSAVDLAAQGKPKPEQIKDSLGGGWTGPEVLAIGICAALSTDSLAEAVMMSINHSGNSDSTGAVCGSLVGAVYRLDNVPGVWLRDLQLRSIIEEIGRDALTEFGPKPKPANDQALNQRYPSTDDVGGLVFTSKLPVVRASGAQTSEDSAHPAADAEAIETPAETTAAAEKSAQAPKTTSPAVHPAVRPARILGCMLGGAVGNALGYPIEADSLDGIRVKHGPSGLTGFGDEHQPSGAISDDTQMMLFTLEGLIRASISRRLNDEVEPAIHVQHAYQRWLHTQGFEWKVAGGPIAATPPDGWLIATRELFARRAPGTSSIQALHSYATGKTVATFDKPVNDSRGSDGVMRAAPAALWPDSPTEVFRLGAQTAAMTDGHPSGYLPAGVLAVIVHQLLADRSLPEAVDRALTELSTWDDHEETSAALRNAIKLSSADETPSAEQIQELGSGATGDQAIAIAVCAALAEPESFTDAVLLAANHSGSSDTTATICGNIMGAAHTVSSIPQKWRSTVEMRETVERLAQDAALEFSASPSSEQTWLDRYPVHTTPSEQAAETTTDGPEAELPQSGSAAAAAAAAGTAAVTVSAVTTTPESAPAEQVETGADSGKSESSEPETSDAEETLSDEELRLLTAWRKFRDGEDDGSSDLTQGLHKLLAEAFGAQRAAQLMGEAANESGSEETSADKPNSTPLPPELTISERVAGSVLGMACGDAIGAPWMFAPLERIEQENPQGVRTPSEAFGRHGAATAISQQAVFLLDGLIRADVRARRDNTTPAWTRTVHTSLQHWLSTQGVPTTPVVLHGALAESAALRAQRFPDEATVTALASRVGDGELPTAANPPNSARTATATARAGVIGFRADTPAHAISLGCELAVTTHGHPDGYWPAGALAGIVRAVADGKTVAESVQTVLDELAAMEGSESTIHALQAGIDLADQGAISANSLDKLGTGWDGPTALAIAVTATLAHPDSYVDAVALSATHSGNSTATAAICATIMGAALGVDAIPQDWLDSLELRKILDDLLTDDQRATADITSDSDVPDWAQRYLA